MWEAIQANTRRSRLLIGLMGTILVALGAMIGAAWGGPELAALGALAALAVWLVQLAVALSGGERVLLRTAGAREIRKEDAPQLWNVVEEMTIASGLGKMPRVFVVDDDAPNAFATGRDADSACVAVTSGLLKRLDRDELQGVIAHEIGHVKNLDIRFLTIAAVMVGSVALLADVFLRSMWYGGGRRRGGGKDGGQAQAVLLALTVVLAIVAPIATQLLYYACSRRREYLADASGARFTRYPAGLASALEKITEHVRTRKGASRVLAPLYIVNPLQASSRSVGLFSTHPPTARRVAILRAMGGNAGYADYEAAYGRVVGGGSCLGARTLRYEPGSVPAREPTPAPEPARDAVQRGREVADLLDRMAHWVLVACLCGVRIKVPPGLERKSIRCTRCGREHPVPTAQPGGASPPGAQAGAGVSVAEMGTDLRSVPSGSVPSERQDASAGMGTDLRSVPAERTGDAAAAAGGTEPLVYRRRGTGWESFRCACGHGVQLSPAFAGGPLSCGRCGRRIDVLVDAGHYNDAVRENPS